MVARRTLLRSVAGLATGTLAVGCSGNGGGDAVTTTAVTDTRTTAPPTTSEEAITDVAAGPEKRLRFRPEAVEITAGSTVRWTFESSGHNVTSKPGASEKCENPDGVEPFASYEGSNHYAVRDPGTTFEHEFSVPGEYVYVCAPHAGQGMVGSITVTE